MQFSESLKRALNALSQEIAAPTNYTDEMGEPEPDPSGRA